MLAMVLASLGWKYTKIRDALRTSLKVEIGRPTVANILLEEGIESPSTKSTSMPAAVLQYDKRRSGAR